jgi:hypothetical protein
MNPEEHAPYLSLRGGETVSEGFMLVWVKGLQRD